MPRPKKPTYEYVPSLRRYRKRIKDVDGKYVAIYGETVRELEEKLQEAIQTIEIARYRIDNPTVADYAKKWLIMHSTHVRQTTMTDYTSCVKIYIIEPIGDKFMVDITADDIKMAMTLCANKSASIYRKVHMLYKQIFRSALESQIIDNDPTETLNPKGGKKAKEKEALSELQIDTLTGSVFGLPVYPFVLLGLYAGLRREEILGLKWENVHLDCNAPYISVRTAWHVEHNRPIVISELKTPAAKRDIPIPVPSDLYSCLIEMQKTTKSEYVICNGSGNALSGTQWKNLWEYVIKRTTKPRKYTRYINGEKIIHEVVPKLGDHAPHNPSVVYTMDFIPTPHQLRHTYITNLLLAGVDVKTVQYLAGHENAKITLDIYTHLIYNRPVDLRDKINSAFSTKSTVASA